ncbi:hypothetical protein KVR01_003058 [Diaporthe batatas]|uniref:uncharacterized protein n=1 Tax=Diaporthe batatas TaxID=748121 RepID=UPI001D037767|nr:uncharacterized protein KVR01_003058 [Diaporthe batatas]KAG8167369.1 hypothetical protein KVR01_003058 [Diaporthe batatas]
MSIHRVTLFKIPKEEDVDFLLDQYKILTKEARKDGAPYIVSIVAGRPLPDERTRGFTLVAKTTFRSLEDMRYYDSSCQAHANFKKHVPSRREGEVVTVYFEDAIGAA